MSPRDGSNIYSQPDPDVVADTTIESAKYNNFTNDIAQDLNLPRPIVAGGTGATSADGALAALGAEKAGQIVTNYDSHVFVAGSFSSASSATSAPAAEAFAGICYMADASNYFIEARSFVNGNIYTRGKVAGVWSVWVNSEAVLDNLKVNRAGDTMTGDLTINKTNAGLIFNQAASATDYSRIQFKKGGLLRWEISGAWGAEGGSNAGSDFSIDRYSDAGSFIETGINIDRSSGTVSTSGSLTVNNDITAIRSPATQGAYYFGNTGTKYLYYDGTNFQLNGGAIAINDGGAWIGGVTTINGSGSALALTLRETVSTYTKPMRVSSVGTLEWRNHANSATIMQLADTGVLSVSNSLELGSQTTPGSAFIDFHSDGTAADYNARIIQSGAGNLQVIGAIVETQSGLWSVGYRCRAGISAGGYTGNNFNINHGTGQQLWIDSTNQGTIAYTSDYRTKKDVTDLPATWDVVKSLRPIKYTHQDFTPPSEQEACAKSGEPFLKGDDIEQWGFIAHELQETLTESASSGVKDSPDTIQSPNPWTVIAALTKALQEAMMRIEALEAR